MPDFRTRWKRRSRRPPPASPNDLRGASGVQRFVSAVSHFHSSTLPGIDERAKPVAQEFSSIEEYIGHNQALYDEVLAAAGGGGYQPERGCKDWIRFCLTGHYRQLQTLLRRNAELGRIYGELEQLVRERGLHARTAVGMLEAAYGARVRNASYRVSADVSNNLASRDLKQLVDARLLLPRGENRGRHYVAGPEVLEIRARHRQPKDIADPFAEPASERAAAEAEGQLPLGV